VNTAAENGVFYGWTTESDCMTECLRSTSCVAIDVGPLGCVLHNNISDLTATYYAPGVTHFILNRSCEPTSPPTTERLLTTTSLVRDTTGM